MNEINTTFCVVEMSVMLDKRLSKTDKLLYGIICALSNNAIHECYASTERLCEVVDIQKRQLQYSLAELVKYNYVSLTRRRGKRYIKPTINKFIEQRRKMKNNKQLDIFDTYDWLNEVE